MGEGNRGEGGQAASRFLPRPRRPTGVQQAQVSPGGGNCTWVRDVLWGAAPVFGRLPAGQAGLWPRARSCEGGGGALPHLCSLRRQSVETHLLEEGGPRCLIFCPRARAGLSPLRRVLCRAQSTFYSVPLCSQLSGPLLRCSAGDEEEARPCPSLHPQIQQPWHTGLLLSP